MNGLMMDYQLNIGAILRRTEAMFARREIVARRPDRSLYRYTYARCLDRARRLAVALHRLGVQPGDRVATFCWNHERHLEAYYGVPASGAVLHTLNLRLHPDELTYIATHAGDSVILVDSVLWPVFEQFGGRVPFKHVIVLSDGAAVPPGTLDYDALLDAADPSGYEFPDVSEQAAGVMCYTSGTTGKPKGVVYSHRALVLHTLGVALAETCGMTERDTVLAVVPLFHANAWGTPFTAAMLGCKQVFPGPHLDPASIVELLVSERVTQAYGVPTIWSGILRYLDAHAGELDLSALRSMIVGGAAVPESMIRAFEERHGLAIVQGWGMTETTPVGSISRLTPELEAAPRELRFAYRAKAGRPLPFVEIRARGEAGLVAWDGATMGELEVRGPWVAGAYYNAPEAADRFTDDGWFRTGDVATIGADGFITIQDRAKDLVKSGGEWISSVALENELVAHPDVAEAVVIGVPHPRWDERPVAVIVPREGRAVTLEAVREFLAPHFARWWLPDAVVIAESIPRTGTGKYQKSVLRAQHRDLFAHLVDQAVTTAVAASDSALPQSPVPPPA